METLAEQPPTTGIEQFKPPALYLVPDIAEEPRVYSVRDAEYEPETQARFNQWLGSLAAQATTETADIEQELPNINLLERLQLAKTRSPEGQEALSMVDINIAKAVAEACFKEDHVTTTSMYRDQAGDLVQFGQTSDSVYRNAITMRPNRHAKLKEITRIEALNGHRIDDALKADRLKDHYFVAASIVPGEVPEDDLGPDGDGYFLDGLTFVVQATTEQNNGNVTTESGFMAGVEADENDNFEERLAKRYDIQSLTIVYEWLGQKPLRTAEEFLNNGLYVPKDLMPNGAVDFMHWCDEAADEVLGRDIERKPEDYMALKLTSKRREASLEDVRQKVREDLLASVDELETPMKAVQLMWHLVKKHTTQDSFENTNIDPKVFGRAAAPYIVKVRQHIQNGAEYLAQDLMQKAHEKSVISGCGGGSSPNANLAGESSESSSESSSGNDRYGSLKFECSNGHTNVRPRNKLLEHCTTCGTSVKC
jgi:hypothetical protein